MRKPANPIELTPEGRLAEIVGILARGFMRLRKDSIRCSEVHAKDPPESDNHPLEVSDETVLNVHDG